MKLDEKELLLYAVTDRSFNKSKTIYKQVEEAIEGGVTLVQLREKELCYESFLDEALKLKELCRKRNVKLIINDNADIAIKSDADGVHVGQSDMNAKDVRSVIGSDKILGVSVQNPEQAVKAQINGADYLGVGAMFYTGSKPDAESVSIKTLKEICKAVDIPVVAIGGINKDNVSELLGSGICGIAVISAVFASDNITEAAAELRGKLK